MLLLGTNNSGFAALRFPVAFGSWSRRPSPGRGVEMNRKREGVSWSALAPFYGVAEFGPGNIEARFLVSANSPAIVLSDYEGELSCAGLHW